MSKEYQQALDILDGRSTLSISPKKKTNFPSLVRIPMSKVTVTVKPNPKVNIINTPSPKKNPLKRPSPEKKPLSSPSPSKIPRVDPKLQAVLSKIPSKSKDQKKSSPIKKFSQEALTFSFPKYVRRGLLFPFVCQEFHRNHRYSASSRVKEQQIWVDVLEDRWSDEA